MRGLLVTGTDTGVGKSVVSACLLAAIAAHDERVRAYKPVLTGLEDAGDANGAGRSTRWPPDHELLAGASGMTPEQVAPLRFGPAVSPHLAAQLAGRRITPEELIVAARERGAEGTLIVEGVGGLLVPLADSYTVLDLAVDLALPLVIAARPGLGTINHTLLTLRAARCAGLDVRAVVLTPWPSEPQPIELSNRDTIARLGEVEVHTLPALAGHEQAAMAAAGSALPWRAWLGESTIV